MKSFVISALVVVLSICAFANDKVIAERSGVIPQSNYVQTDNPTCPNGAADGATAAQIASAVASVSNLPAGVLLPWATVVAGYLANSGGDIAKALVPASARHASCGYFVFRIPEGTRAVRADVFMAEMRGGYGECLQVEPTITKCPVGWAGFYSYRQGNILVVVVKNWSHNRARQANVKVLGEVWTAQHKVTQGESLWSIAKEQYGDTNVWARIYNANKTILGDNPSVLPAGLTLIMPIPANW